MISLNLSEEKILLQTREISVIQRDISPSVVQFGDDFRVILDSFLYKG